MISFEVDCVPICSWRDLEDSSGNLKGDFYMKEQCAMKPVESGYFKPTDAYLKPYIDYAKHDAKTCSNMKAGNAAMNYRDFKKKMEEKNMSLNIKKVLFNGNATIVFWSDNTKTVVRCGLKDYYDTEKGLAMAIAKKFLGNRGSYYEIFKKWIPNADEQSMCADCKFGDSPEVGAGPCDKCSFSKDHPVGSKFVKAEN